MFNKNKTKWKPLYFYNPVATTERQMIFARYDKKTGLFEFKTVKICDSMSSLEKFKIDINPQSVFEKLQECE